MTGVRVKICGLTRRPDAELAAASGADYGGVILAPGGKRSIRPEDARRLFDDLPLRSVGVFVDEEPLSLRRRAEIASVQVVQLHGRETPDFAAALRDEGRWEVWKALRPRSGEEFVTEVERFAGSVDAVLLDGWSASAPGGTGARFPWEVVAALREKVPSSLRLIVAGGLSPDNVAAAVLLLTPDAVDVSSGVEERPGVKSASAVPKFITAARRAALEPRTQS